MSERDDRPRREEEAPREVDRGDEPRERADEGPDEPVPGIQHEPEPDGENIIPAKDQPGTL